MTEQQRQDARLLDRVDGLADLSDADLVRLAQLLLDQADESIRVQDRIAKLLEVPSIEVRR